MKKILIIFKRVFIIGFLFLLISCQEPEGITSKAVFFPDGKTILFAASRNKVSNIYTYNLETKKLTNITENTDSDLIYNSPSLSPTASMIIYSKMRQSKYKEGAHIYIMRADDSSDIKQITNGRIWDFEAVFSPDGKDIIFSRILKFMPKQAFGATQSDVDLYSMRIDGTDIRKITSRAFSFIYSPSISPNGELVLFAATTRNSDPLSKKNSMFNNFIFLINRYNHDILKPLISKSGFNTDPSFSPTGEKITFLSGENIFVVDNDGENIRQITNNDSYNSYPVFSPDMKIILFLSDKERNKKNKLMQINSDGMDLKEINIFGD